MNDTDFLSPLDRARMEPDAAAPQPHSSGVSPGKSTLTSRLPARPFDLRVAQPSPRGRIDRDASGDGATNDNANGALARARAGASTGLDADLLVHLEAALGVDLQGVGVHANTASGEAAASIGANAYAEGQDIYFAEGQYDPGSAAGKRLIAHEVAHTVQQRGAPSTGVQASLEISSPGDAHEREADVFADAFVAGGTARLTTAAPAGMAHRDKHEAKGGAFADQDQSRQKTLFRKAGPTEQAALLDEVDSKRGQTLFESIREDQQVLLLAALSPSRRKRFLRTMNDAGIAKLFGTVFGVAAAMPVFQVLDRRDLVGVLYRLGPVDEATLFTMVKPHQRDEMIAVMDAQELHWVARALSLGAIKHAWPTLNSHSRRLLFGALPADMQDAVAMETQDAGDADADEAQ